MTKRLTVIYYWNGDRIPENQISNFKQQLLQISRIKNELNIDFNIKIYSTNRTITTIESQMSKDDSFSELPIAYVDILDTINEALIPTDKKRSIQDQFEFLEAQHGYSCQRDLLVANILQHARNNRTSNEDIFLLFEFDVIISNKFTQSVAHWFEKDFVLKLLPSGDSSTLTPSVIVASSNDLTDHILHNYVSCVASLWEVMGTRRFLQSVFEDTTSYRVHPEFAPEKVYRIMSTYGNFPSLLLLPFIGRNQNGHLSLFDNALSQEVFDPNHQKSWNDVQPHVNLVELFYKELNSGQQNFDSYLTSKFFFHIDFQESKQIINLSNNETFKVSAFKFLSALITRTKIHKRSQSLLMGSLSEKNLNQLLRRSVVSIPCFEITEFLISFRHNLNIDIQAKTSKGKTAADLSNQQKNYRAQDLIAQALESDQIYSGPYKMAWPNEFAPHCDRILSRLQGEFRQRTNHHPSNESTSATAKVLDTGQSIFNQKSVTEVATSPDQQDKEYSHTINLASN